MYTGARKRLCLGNYMDKIKWIERQLKKYHLADSLWHFFVYLLLDITAISVLALFIKMGYRQWWIYVLAGIFLFFGEYLLFSCLAQNKQITKVTHTKPFTAIFNFIQLVCNLGLVVVGLALAVYAIKPAGGNVMTSADTLFNAYINLLYIFGGILLSALILLTIQFVFGFLRVVKEERDNGIREIAHHIWEQEGCPQGRDKEHWLKATKKWEEEHSRINRTLACLGKNKQRNV
jgi:hypothetical protein